MALPLWMKAITGGVLGGGSAAITGSALDPVSRSVVYFANAQMPNLVPSIPQISQSYSQAMLALPSYAVCMEKHGAVFSTITPTVPRSEWKDQQIETPTDTHYVTGDPWLAYLQGLTWSPSLETLLVMINRGYVDANTARHYLQRLGMRDPAVRDAAKQLAKYIPPVQDLVRFVVKETFDDKLGEWPKADAELPDNFRWWAERQGLGKMSLHDDTAPKKVRETDWVKHYWRAHYGWPSPTQAYQFLHRLRGAGGPGGRARDPSGETFTDTDLSNLLRVLDYVPSSRAKLAAISYRVIGRVDIRRLLLYKIVDVAEVKEMYQDQGYNARDAVKLASLTEEWVKRTQLGSMSKATRSQIEQAYRYGIADRQQALQLLARHGLSDEEAQLAIAVIDVSIATSRAKTGTTIVRQRLFSGMINRNQAQAELGLLGMTQAAINDFISLWDIQMSGPRKLLQAGKVQDLVGRGLLDAQDASTMLSNLGYTANESLLLVAAGSQDLAAAQMKAALAAARSKQAAARELARIAKEQQAKVDKLKRELARVSGPSLLRRWLRKCLITPAHALNRLAQLDWPAAEAQTFVDEAMGVGCAPPAGGSVEGNGDGEAT